MKSGYYIESIDRLLSFLKIRCYDDLHLAFNDTKIVNIDHLLAHLNLNYNPKLPDPSRYPSRSLCMLSDIKNLPFNDFVGVEPPLKGSLTYDEYVVYKVRLRGYDYFAEISTKQPEFAVWAKIS